MSFLMDHGRFGPPGILGGAEGAKNEVVLSLKGRKYAPEHWSKDEGIPFEEDDVVEVRTPGGGGYGRAIERSEQSVQRDVQRGYYTVEDAVRDYAVVLREGAELSIDHPATTRLRTNRTA